MTERGSVLVPAVVALVVLFACGLAVAESFAAQRGQATLDRGDERARFIAEAGLWHAGWIDAPILAPTAFGGGTYTVAEIGGSYAGTSVLADLSHTVELDLGPPGTGGDLSPLDEAASVATVDASNARRFSIDLVSAVPAGVVIEDVSLFAGSGSHLLRRIQMDGQTVWIRWWGDWLPAIELPFVYATPVEWTVPAGGSVTFTADFWTAGFAPVEFTLVLRFSNGGTTTLVFTVPW